MGEAAPFTLGGVKGFERGASFVTLDCGGPRLRIAAVAPDIVRVTLAPDGIFREDSYAVVWRGEAPVEVEDSGEALVVKTQKLVVRVHKGAASLEVYDTEGRYICSTHTPAVAWTPSRWGGHAVKLFMRLHVDDHFYGLGEKALPLDRRRYRVTMWNTDAFGYRAGTDPLYMSIPFMIVLRKGLAYGVFFENPYRSTFDLGATSEEFWSFEAEGGQLDFYIIHGPSMKEVVERYTQLTGRMPLPPLWALGHQQSRYSYYPQERIIEVAERYRREGIPCDAIYLDIHYMDGYRLFTWDRKRFPNPKEMAEKLHRMGFKLVTIVDVGIKLDPGYAAFREGVLNDYFVRMPNGDLYVGRVWPGLCAFPDFTRAEVREWWGSLLTALIEQGVDGIWLDMNEPSIFDVPTKTMDVEALHADGPHAKVHNVYALLEAQATYEGLLKLKPGIRPFILTRAGFAGIQRYAAKWTGDNTADWEHLWLQIPMLLSLGLSGVPFVGADVGGFFGRPTPELLVRWYQVAAFTPLCRNHQCMGSYDHEPWFHGPTAREAIKRVLELRYRLLPYLYSLFYEHCAKGYPVMRPLVFEYQDDGETYQLDDEFLVGPFLLVAPVLKEGARSREVYLPAGEWFDFWTDRVYKGPARLVVEAPLDRVPLFVRAGAVIPEWPPMNHVGEGKPDPLYLHVYAGNGSFTLYEDDGETLEYTKGAYALTKISANLTEEHLLIEVGGREGKYQPERKHVVVIVHGTREVAKVLRNDVELAPLTSLEEAREGVVKVDGKVFIKVRDAVEGFKLELVFK
ncbi:MAG: glycoside hydrolase family 31 protein [Thermofilaceae archaeon]